jgi:hypothetical protein
LEHSVRGVRRKLASGPFSISSIADIEPSLVQPAATTGRRCSPASAGEQGFEGHMPAKKSKRWIQNVKTFSTFPPAGLFTKDAATIARSLASKKVSPKGVASGLRMLLYFMNRAGRGLTAERCAELTKAKALLSRRLQQSKKGRSSKKAA